MSIQPLRAEQSAAEPGGRIHRDFFRWLGQLGSAMNTPANTAVLLPNIALTTGVENLVEHGQGGPLKTWWPADLQSFAIIKRYTASTADRSVYLPLETSANVTCDIFVVPA